MSDSRPDAPGGEAPDSTKAWDDRGRQNALGFVLPAPGGRKNQWSLELFYATGTRSVDEVLRRVGDLGVPLSRGSALDFGCGPGRLTQALADHFQSVIGVDVAPSMVEAARQHNRRPQNCSFLLNATNDLRQFSEASFDFVLSDMVLQHIRPAEARQYLFEILRVLRPGGLTVFYYPGRRVRRGWAPWLIAAYNRIRFDTSSTFNYGVEKPQLVAALEGRGATVLSVQGDEWLDRGEGPGGPPPALVERIWKDADWLLADRYEPLVYFVQKEAPRAASATTPPAKARDR